VTGGLKAVGYIDRDGLPDNVLDADADIKAHPVFEIEGFICLETVFKAVARYTGLDESTTDNRYRDFITTAKSAFKDVSLNKEFLIEPKRAEVVLVALMNPIKPDPELGKVRARFESATPAGGWQPTLQQMFSEEETRLRTSLAGAFSDFIRDFPSKSYFSIAAQKLEMTPDAVVRTISQALKIAEKEAREQEVGRAARRGSVRAVTLHVST